jgi:hypothetical protein
MKKIKTLFYKVQMPHKVERFNPFYEYGETSACGPRQQQIVYHYQWSVRVVTTTTK